MTATKTHIIILLITILCPACRLNASMQANSEAEIMKSYADKQYEEGNFPGALSLYINSMEKAENEEDNDTYMACIGNIANIYEALGDYESNLFYLLKGYDISRRLNNNDLRNKYLTNIVAAYCNLGDVKKAKEFYEISKKATGSRDTVNHKYFLIYNSARIKQAEKKYDEAIAEHAKAERYAIDNGLDDIYALYQECETGNILIKKHDYGKAISQGRKCLEMAAAADNDEMKISAYKIMHEAFAGCGMADSARKYKMMYLEAYDAAFRTKSMNQAKGRLQAGIRVAQKHGENQPPHLTHQHLHAGRNTRVNTACPHGCAHRGARTQEPQPAQRTKTANQQEQRHNEVIQAKQPSHTYDARRMPRQ